MKENGLLFSHPMIRAVKAEVKVQTRRVVDVPDGWEVAAYNGDGWGHYPPLEGNKVILQSHDLDHGRELLCPYGVVGDRLYVKESFCNKSCQHHHGEMIYRADGWGKGECNWTNALFMPKWAARLWLEIIGVRAERLQAINEADARAEGFPLQEHMDELNMFLAQHGGQLKRSRAEISFGFTWDALNKKRGYGWDQNPLVWVITFRLMKNAG